MITVYAISIFITFKSILPPSLFLLLLLLICACVIRTHYKIYLLSKLQVFNIVLLTVGSLLYSKSLGLVHLA